MTKKHVNIAPGVSVLGILKHLNYKPWYAIAEFVDNAIQSHKVLQSMSSSPPPKLRVDIDVDTTNPPRISIRDNAGGIHLSDFARAFRPATVPPDRSGLAEFGMGIGGQKARPCVGQTATELLATATVSNRTGSPNEMLDASKAATSGFRCYCACARRLGDTSVRR